VLLAGLLVMALQQGATGRVEIMVRDANTREGVPGVPVTLTFKFPTEPAGPSTTLLTDPRGLAAFSALGAGNYIIKLGDAFRPLPFTEYIWVDAGDQKRVELAVNRIANVSVRVLDQNGEPIKNALVTLPSLAYINGRPTLNEVPGIRHNTDGKGGYQLTGVPSGEYFLRIAQVTPTVNDLQEAPPPEAFYPGVLDFASATRVTVRGDDVMLGEVRLPLQRVFKISGTVINPAASTEAPATAPERRTVTEFFLTPVNSLFMPSLQRVRYITQPDPREVSFEFDGLPAGTYALYPVFISIAEAANFSNRTVVTISDRDVEGVRIVLNRRLRLEAGVIMNGESSKLPETLRLGLVSKDPLPPLLSDSSIPIYSPDPQTGKFELLGMVEGIRYGLTFSGLPADAYVADIRSGGLSLLSEGSFLAHPSQPPIEIQIGTQGAVVRGVVRDSMSQPVAGAAVIVVPDFARRKNSFLYTRATADAAGQFSIRGLAPGDYQLFAWPSPPLHGAEESPVFLGPFESRGVTVRANSGVTTETSLRVIQ
jgi:hypothetical protein